MARCLASAYVSPECMKRCIRDDSETHQHLWVEATTTAGTALVVRWEGHSKEPTEVLIAMALPQEVKEL